MNEIRMVTPSDIPYLKQVLDSIELFPSEMLDEMIADFFDNPESEDVWFTALQNEEAISIGFCSPEKLTEGTYNLYALGIRSDIQAKGIGSKMMSFIEDHLRNKGSRVLIVDTSGTEDFQLTRNFYEKLNYNKEAVIRDFWAEGDDKVVYWKKLN